MGNERDRKGVKAGEPSGSGTSMRAPQGLTILLVEDDLGVREAVAEILTQEGYSVREAANAEQGLARMREGGLDLVIADYRMPPGKDGVWMLKEAATQNLLTATQVLLFSADETIEGVEDVRRLKKPIDADA